MAESVSLLKRQDVERLTGLGRSAIYARMNPNHKHHDPSFPKPVPISGPLNNPAAVRWVSSEVDAWIKARISARDACHSA